MKPTGRHILLFEKDKGLERILTLILKQADLRVTRLNSIETTLAWLASHEGKEKENILIIDVSGADHEEEQIFRQLQDSDSDLPVILLSPYGSDKINPDKRGSIKYRTLDTPFSPEELLECVIKTQERDKEFSESV